MSDEVKHTPERFAVSWDSWVGAYKVSIPNYEGGEVVNAADYDRLREVNADLLAALEEIIAGHTMGSGYAPRGAAFGAWAESKARAAIARARGENVNA